MITLLAEYQTEHLMDVLAFYRRAITKELSKPLKTRAKKQYLQDKLLITDEIASAINILESEVTQ
jgi:hypothetical protein